GFNINLIRETRALMQRLRNDGVEIELHIVGRKGNSYFKFRRVAIASSKTDLSDYPSTDDAGALIEPLAEKFIRGEVDAVYVVYAQFKSALATPPTTMQVLPVPEPKKEEGAARAGKWVANYILSPSADEIRVKLLPLYVRN